MRTSSLAVAEAHRRYVQAQISRLERRQHSLDSQVATWKEELNRTDTEIQQLKEEMTHECS